MQGIEKPKKGLPYALPEGDLERKMVRIWTEAQLWTIDLVYSFARECTVVHVVEKTHFCDVKWKSKHRFFNF